MEKIKIAVYITLILMIKGAIIYGGISIAKYLNVTNTIETVVAIVLFQEFLGLLVQPFMSAYGKNK